MHSTKTVVSPNTGAGKRSASNRRYIVCRDNTSAVGTIEFIRRSDSLAVALQAQRQVPGRYVWDTVEGKAVTAQTLVERRRASAPTLTGAPRAVRITATIELDNGKSIDLTVDENGHTEKGDLYAGLLPAGVLIGDIDRAFRADRHRHVLTVAQEGA